MLAREARVNVMIEPYTRERLEFYSKGMGLSMSALCAYVLSDYVFKQDLVINQMMQVLSPESVAKLMDAEVEHSKLLLDRMQGESAQQR